MASSSVSKAAKQPSGSATLTAEEETLLDMYGELARWDRNFIFMIVQSLAYGALTPETDQTSWDELRRSCGLRKSGKAVSHGN